MRYKLQCAMNNLWVSVVRLRCQETNAHNINIYMYIHIAKHVCELSCKKNLHARATQKVHLKVKAWLKRQLPRFLEQCCSLGGFLGLQDQQKERHEWHLS